MRKIYTILLAVLLTASVFAQAPEKMSYQAVIRNSSDVLVPNGQIGMEINIRQGAPTGPVVYTETQTPTTNANGLVSIEIGGGAGFSTINWASDDYFIETRTAVVPPFTTYTITGTSQLLSVPFALHAKTAENGITTAQADEIAGNTLKVGYTDALVSANADVVANSAKVGITTEQTDAIAANTLKVGYTDVLVSANADVVANTAKEGITTEQADAITANTAKVGYTDALVSANADVVANTAKVGITTEQTDAITANTAKVGYTDVLVSANADVVANSAKVGITTELANEIAANTLKVGYTDALVSANADVVANTAKNSYPAADAAKLAAITGANTGDQTLAGMLATNADAGAAKISNLADPTQAQDAATKAYVDAIRYWLRDNLIVDFYVDKTLVDRYVTISFTPVIALTPSSYLWDFGDGNTSTEARPTHMYEGFDGGFRTISLTVNFGDFERTETKINYINVLGK